MGGSMLPRIRRAGFGPTPCQLSGSSRPTAAQHSRSSPPVSPKSEIPSSSAYVSAPRIQRFASRNSPMRFSMWPLPHPFSTAAILISSLATAVAATDTRKPLSLRRPQTPVQAPSASASVTGSEPGADGGGSMDAPSPRGGGAMDPLFVVLLAQLAFAGVLRRRSAPRQ